MNTIILNFLLAPEMLREQILSCKSAIRKITGVSDFGFNVRAKYRRHTGTGLRFEVSSERPEERRIEPATPE